MPSPKKYIAYLTVTIVLFGATYYLLSSAFTTPLITTTPAAPDAGAIGAENAAMPRYVIPVLAETTVLGAMEQYAAANHGFSFSGRDFPGLGFYVEELNGKKSGSGFYWILYVNGTSSELGASSVRVHPGDVVKWRYEKGY